MARSRPFAYNNTGSPISGTTQYDDLVVGDIDADYGSDYGGVTWWGGPDEELRYIIGNVRLGGQPVPSGVTETAYVGFWGTPLGNKNQSSFLNLANYVGAKNGQPPFANASDAVIWLNANGFYTSYGPSVWRTGGAMITARHELAGAGTQNAGLAFGGQVTPCSPYFTSCTEEYNGTSWSPGGAMITPRGDLAGTGTQDCALAFGGVNGALVQVSCTEEYNGTSWSPGGAMITARPELAGAGTQNEALAFGGDFGICPCRCTEEYNGGTNTWISCGDLITGRAFLAGAGTQNAGLAFGGCSSGGGGKGSLDPQYACTEEYDGSSWSAGGALIVARGSLAGAGTQNSALAFGSGNSGTCTEEYDGTSWSVGGALSTGRYNLAGAGSQTSAVAFGGGSGFFFFCNNTEEYS